jgi:GNAT superfamily N-acetyltransferase
MAIEVRRAGPDDAAEIREVAVASWRDTYAGHLRPETTEAFLDRSYSFERLERRIRDDLFLVALEEPRLVAFPNPRPEEERLDLLAIYARPESRGRGVGSALLAAVVDDAGGRPIAADVLQGNRKGEAFYEARGFTPRETLEVDLFDERVTLRRWWLAVSPT